MSNVTMIKQPEKKARNKILRLAENCREDYSALEDLLNDNWFLTDVVCIPGTPSYHPSATVFILYKD
jgi:hypothetical protein